MMTLRPVSYDQRSRLPEVPGAPGTSGSLNSTVRSRVGRKRFWIGALFLGAALLIAAVGFFFIQNLFKAEKEAALVFLLKNPQAMEALGSPVEAGWLITGKVSSNPKTGCARLTIPVTGSIRSGSVFYAAIKWDGRWFVLHEYLSVGDKRIVIIDYPPNANYYSLPKECRE